MNTNHGGFRYLDRLETKVRSVLTLAEITLLFGTWYFGYSSFIVVFAALFSTSIIDFAIKPSELIDRFQGDYLFKGRRITIMASIGGPLLIAALIFSFSQLFFHLSFGVFLTVFLLGMIIPALVTLHKLTQKIISNTQIHPKELMDYLTLVSIPFTSLLGGLGIGYYIGSSFSDSALTGTIAIIMLSTLFLMIVMTSLFDPKFKSRFHWWDLLTTFFVGIGLAAGVNAYEFVVRNSEFHYWGSLISYTIPIAYVFSLAMIKWNLARDD